MASRRQMAHLLTACNLLNSARRLLVSLSTVLSACRRANQSSNSENGDAWSRMLPGLLSLLHDHGRLTENQS